uniref:Ionotropic receptor 7 n=1 Tax=Propsilocerus akamusi TaxID=903466 RepID=A0A7D0TCX2_9DIPT|nr:ionotropic receptor 7 [Propsilocerus akamusi]
MGGIVFIAMLSEIPCVLDPSSSSHLIFLTRGPPSSFTTSENKRTASYVNAVSIRIFSAVSPSGTSSSSSSSSAFTSSSPSSEVLSSPSLSFLSLLSFSAFSMNFSRKNSVTCTTIGSSGFINRTPVMLLSLCWNGSKSIVCMSSDVIMN